MESIWQSVFGGRLRIGTTAIQAGSEGEGEGSVEKQATPAKGWGMFDDDYEMRFSSALLHICQILVCDIRIFAITGATSVSQSDYQGVR